MLMIFHFLLFLNFNIFPFVDFFPYMNLYRKAAHGFNVWEENTKCNVPEKVTVNSR